jgi:PAS domain S-box-containing protein
MRQRATQRKRSKRHCRSSEPQSEGRQRAASDAGGGDDLQENAQWYRLIVNNVRDFAIFSTDTRGRISSWNPGAERFFGYPCDEVLGKPMDLLYTPEDRAAGIADRERAEALARGTSEDERWHLRKDGSRFFVFGRVNPMYSDCEKHCGFIKIARDITTRKDLQTWLASSEELHRLILKSIQDFAIFTMDPVGKIDTWNTGAENTYGYTVAEIAGQSMAILYTPEDRASGEPERNMAQAVKDAHLAQEHWCVRKDGRRIFVTGVLRPVRDDTGSIRGFCKVGRDITARWDLQHQLECSRAELEKVVAERTAALTDTVHELERFSYSLSHDMRAPLRAMQGFADVLLTRYGDKFAGEPEQLLRRISASAQRLDRLIKESLGYYRTPREPLPLQPTRLGPLLETLSSERPDLAQALTMTRPLLDVMAHPPSLEQCLGNLLENARRFVPEGRRPQVRVWTEDAGGRIRIYVEDNGIGIATGDQAKIWELFARLHPTEFEGTGIGLALVRKAVERMGGTAGVESEPEKGSRFWLELAAPKSA